MLSISISAKKHSDIRKLYQKEWQLKSEIFCNFFKVRTRNIYLADLSQ